MQSTFTNYFAFFNFQAKDTSDYARKSERPYVIFEGLSKMGVIARSYLSPTLVLLAFDYPEGKNEKTFVGFAIKRTTSAGHLSTFLPNRVGFNGPNADGSPQPSDVWPIQKFYWWDANITTNDRGTKFTYEIIPTFGPPPNLTFQQGLSINVTVPKLVENGIGTYFNRAVVSSQAFVKEFGHQPTGDDLHKAYQWLGNGMETVVADFLATAGKAGHDIEGAIYHLSQSDQGEFIIPAMAAFENNEDLVYHANDTTDQSAIRQLKPAGVTFSPRTKTHIMHDKFLVAVDSAGKAQRLVMGSANYTTEGLTQQANLMHTWDSPELAALYLTQKKLIENDPTIGETAKAAEWSNPVKIGDATVRAFFPPEPRVPKGEEGTSIGTVIEAVKKATDSVVFCLFAPTDMELLNSCFALADKDKMMLGLVNAVPDHDPQPNAKGVTDPVKVAIYNRNSKPQNLIVAGHEAFTKSNTPMGFSWEDSVLGKGGKFPVFIHHKFVVIDGETDHPVIYSGSANMSANSVFYNDENLLEITDCPRMAQLYLAEFMRLFEHYRARLAFDLKTNDEGDTFKLTPDNSWSNDWYAPGSKASSRVAMAASLK
jgi:phosphatidylserine/phosphatidylglycerophosphate/cardiolipin synthase-like enzyme